MFNNVFKLIIKTVIIIIFLLLILSINNAIALIFGIRPQTVIAYALVGVGASYISLMFYDRAVEKKEDPLPEYILKEVEITREEVEVLKSIIHEKIDMSDTTEEEIRVRAKVREREKRERENQSRSKES
ncbi:membrane protein [Staphylococcus phage vB_SscM-1]|uniref:Membrane protein n=2 Tax=Sciuriunavirus SscM1 TaxID=2734053 RepID=A0A1X9I9N7_9CAUD|nr:membrane protein [Staphylococcus phage vB_SscM-1]ANT44741.1 membrane protein [Staphylococcus phage vB_SscM-1]ANT44943.1 membrane protein [Staphylococcus phage vB_SscM-2]QQV88468.1 membrane protein [Staphylococcus phage ZCSS1]